MSETTVKSPEGERILYVQGISGMGKSWFIKQGEAWCIKYGFLWRTVDFKLNAYHPLDYLNVIDELLLPDEAAFDKYRALREQITAGDKERGRAFTDENQQALTRAFVLGLTGLPAGKREVYFLDQHSGEREQASKEVERWLLDVFLPLFQNQMLNLSRVTVVLAGSTRPAELDQTVWYGILAQETLKSFSRDDFIRYAKKRGLSNVSDETLIANYNGALAGLPPGAEPTPRFLAYAVDKLMRPQYSGGLQ